MLPLNNTNNFLYLPVKNVCILVKTYKLSIFSINKKYLIFYILNNSTVNYYFNFKLTEPSFYNKIINYMIPYWDKIIFKGKGYRIRCFKRNKKFTFNFGRSHWTKLKCGDLWFLFRFARQKFYISTLLLSDYLIFKKTLQNIKKPNRYTLRGLRLKKQLIKRRFGKISQYISSLH